MHRSSYAPILEPLARIRGVRAALVVDATDGIVVDAILQVGDDGGRTAALAAALYRRAIRSATAAGLGDTGFLQLDAAQGRLCAIGGPALALVVVADQAVNVGVIRIEMRRAAGALAA